MVSVAVAEALEVSQMPVFQAPDYVSLRNGHASSASIQPLMNGQSGDDKAPTAPLQLSQPTAPLQLSQPTAPLQLSQPTAPLQLSQVPESPTDEDFPPQIRFR